MKRLLMMTGLLLSGGAFAVADRIGDWWVAVPPSVLQKMSMSERTCAERAVKLADSGSHRAAANEWKRFGTEFLAKAAEESLAWASFMQAYELCKARDLNKGIELYSETIELYPDSLASCAALFCRGAANGQNGKGRKEQDDYAELVATEAYARHPLVYTAHNRMGWSALGSGNLSRAKEEWRAVTELKRDLNRSEYDTAKGHLALIESLTNPDGVMDDLVAKYGDKPEKCRDELRNWRNTVWWQVWTNQNLPRKYFEQNLRGAKNANEARMAFLNKMTKSFLAKGAPAFKSAGSDWELLMIAFDSFTQLDPKSVEELVNKVGAEVRKGTDPKVRSDRALAFIGRLRNLRRQTEAKLFLDLIQDPVKRAWTAVDIGWDVRDGAFIIKNLEPIEALPDAKVADGAKRNHARCCQEILKDYDAAIKLYEEAPEPPSTLWAVANCHRAAGRKPRAQGVLDEICSMFPNDAPNAMLTKGDWYAQDGDKKNAIGCYRRILAHAEWKKAGAASQAHQRLEALGIATGGAVLNDVH